MHFLWFCLIGLAAGWLAAQIMEKRKEGPITYLVIGVIGALLGGLVFRLVGLSANNLIGSLIVATVGSVLLLWLIQKLKL